MKIRKFAQFEQTSIKESIWSRLFGKDKVTPGAEDQLKSQGYSHQGKEDDNSNYIVFQGQKFHNDDIEYDDYNSTKPIPRVEGGKLIIANPIWKN